ncbi:MAG: hypothetical protein ACKVHE_28235 [Planctomycetales bacterium]|jgi:hypothetical protein
MLDSVAGLTRIFVADIIPQNEIKRSHLYPNLAQREYQGRCLWMSVSNVVAGIHGGLMAVMTRTALH